MATAATPNTAVPSLLSPGWLTADTSAMQATGRVPVTQDNTSGLPNPQVPVSDDVISYGTVPGPGQAGEAWVTSSEFPWPALAPDGDGVVAVTPGMTGNGNDNDDPSGLPGYDGPQLRYGNAYTNSAQQGGLDAVAQQTTAWGFNVMNPGANMGYQRTETRLMGNTSPGYWTGANFWQPIRSVTPAVKTANQFTQQPLTSMTGETIPLPAYADLSMANSGGTAYFVEGPQAPQVSEATPSQYLNPDPAAVWA